MSKINIMIMFLSRVGSVNPVEYGFAEKCECTNESAVRYVVDRLAEPDPDDKDGIGYQRKLNELFVFCSKEVRKNLEIKNEDGTYKYCDEFGKPVTHYGFFRNRILNVIPNFDEITGYYKDDELKNSVNYDETYVASDNEKTVNETMRCVAEMVEKIFKRLKDVDLKDVTIHADMTGGLRYSSMMLMAVLRLMQYRGIKIGYLAYSNLIFPEKISGYMERLNPIYGLLDMVSGAEEFKKYGSVNILADYFQEVIRYNGKNAVIEKLDNLIKAMKFFADEIRLCHYVRLMKAANNLKKALNDFQKVDFTLDYIDVRERLLNTLTPVFFESYKEILVDKIDDLALIKWCVKHDCLQQALTLYVERIPQLLAEKIVIISDKHKNVLMEAYLGHDTRYPLDKHEKSRAENFEYWCLTHIEAWHFDGKGIDTETAIKKYRENVCRLIKDCIKAKKIVNVDEVISSINSIIKESKYEILLVNEKRLCDILKAMEMCSIDVKLLLPSMQDKTDDYIFVNEALAIIVDDFTEEQKREWDSKKKGFERFKYIKEIMSNWTNEQYEGKIFDLEYAWPGKSLRIGLCMEAGIYVLNDVVNKNEFINILTDYNLIKDERNNTNHAKNDTEYKFASAKDLSEFIMDKVEFLENRIRKNCTAK